MLDNNEDSLMKKIDADMLMTIVLSVILLLLILNAKNQFSKETT
jgi:hypothetical protein